MRAIVALLALVCASLGGPAFVGAQEAQGTPEPTVAGSAPAPTGTGVVTPAASPTPEIADMLVSGVAWIDGRWLLGSAPIRAYVGDTECGTGRQVMPPDGGPRFFLSVASVDTKTGCGSDGAELTFSVDGKRANETIEFNAGLIVQLTLTVGAPFQQVHGDFTPIISDIFDNDWQSAEVLVVPLIDGTLCGDALAPLFGDGPSWGYHVVVDSEQITPGCGRPGVTVQFSLRARSRATGAVVWQRIAPQTIAWEPAVFSGVHLDFTSSRRVSALPSTGTGGQHRSMSTAVIIAGFGASVVLLGASAARRRSPPTSDQHPVDHL